VHGLIYGLHDGLLRDLAVRIDSPDALEAIYRTRTHVSPRAAASGFVRPANGVVLDLEP
jgi:carbonic anhydrase